ncbi:MAG: AMP-binding protein [Acidimicrobiales bacterium]
MYDGIETFGAVVAHRAENDGDRRFVRFEETELTFGELSDGGNRIANALVSLGIGKGDKVAVMLPNGPEYLVTWTGLCRLGVVEVPINVAYKGDLFAYLLNQAECRAIVVARQWVDRVAAVAARLETLDHVVVVGDGAVQSVAGVTTHDFAGFVASAATTDPGVAVATEDPSVILFTSGTTGPSKGAVLSHKANFRLCTNVIDLMGYGAGERLFTVFPLFHVNARYNTILPGLVLDDSDCVMHDRFSASRFWDFCRAEGVTAINYMGALLMMLFKQPERDDDADNPVRRAYGAPSPVEIHEAFEKRFDVKIVEVYGSTETGTATMNTVENFKLGSCGFAVPYYDVKIFDEMDNEVPPGTEGEIVVRPKEPYVMFTEYYRNPEATVKAFRNLWFHTGDRGVMDTDGYFTFVDRMKDAIRRRGENISSWEVEKVIADHPAVLDAAVVGVPSELTEEEVLVVIQLNEDAELDPVELLDHCQDRMAHFAVPRYVRFVDAMPRTPSQRIEKYKLREEGLTDDTWDRESVGYEVRR